jgi:hypothetical protein
MKLTKYHKQVLGMSLDVFEECGDDSFSDIRDNSRLYDAFRELKKASISSSKGPKNLANKNVVKACLKKLGS